MNTLICTFFGVEIRHLTNSPKRVILIASAAYICIKQSTDSLSMVRVLKLSVPELKKMIFSLYDVSPERY